LPDISYIAVFWQCANDMHDLRHINKPDTLQLISCIYNFVVAEYVRYL